MRAGIRRGRAGAPGGTTGGRPRSGVRAGPRAPGRRRRRGLIRGQDEAGAGHAPWPRVIRQSERITGGLAGALAPHEELLIS